jgi:hypothetical protein
MSPCHVVKVRVTSLDANNTWAGGIAETTSCPLPTPQLGSRGACRVEVKLGAEVGDRRGCSTPTPRPLHSRRLVCDTICSLSCRQSNTTVATGITSSLTCHWFQIDN